MDAKRICILSPHRDDAAFSCGLILQSLLLAGARVTVVNVCTRSEYAPFFSPTSSRLEAVSELRRKEDHKFIDELITASQVDRCMLEVAELGWLDAPLRWNMPDEQTLHPHELKVYELNSLAEEVENFRESDIVLAPLALGGHMDHRLVRSAALLTIPIRRLALYEELPYAARVEDAQVTGSGAFQLQRYRTDDASAPHALAWDEWSRRCYPARPLPEPGLKRRYALCYASQIDEHTAQEIGDYSEALGGRERLQGPISVLDQIDDFLKSR